LIATLAGARARPALDGDDDDDAELARRVSAIRSSPSYRLAEQDGDFLESDAARASRLALEFERVDARLREQRIRSTVVVFGSARILEPRVARKRLTEAEHAAGDALERATHLARARAALSLSRYYDEARALAAGLPRRDARSDAYDFVIATGGGPGIMEAANRGASEIGVPTIGFNIDLPHEQSPNPYITPSLAFRFRYFALRKMHFLLRARALVAFPGGYGTLDELFEALNLVQSGKMRRIPIVLVGQEFWQRLVDFDALLEQGLISAGDRQLFCVVESGFEAARRIVAFHSQAADADQGGPLPYPSATST
jgi:uncharacterized protein (TIGR00730 family)